MGNDRGSRGFGNIEIYVGGNSFSDFFSMLEGMMRPKYDFGSAHYDFDLNESLTEEQIEEIVEKSSSKYFVSFKRSWSKDDSPHVKTVIGNMLRKETKLQFSDENIFQFHDSTRDSLDYLLSKISEKHDGKPIALPLPNWHFWLLGGFKRHAYDFSYFNSLNDDQLIEGFKKLAKSGEISGLMLVNPSNPLMQRLNENAANELDKIALKYGVEIVIDEVLRGVQPLNDRDSAGRFFSRPYVAEGFSKRFGDQPLGDISYILVPNSDRLKIKRGKVDMYCTRNLEVALKYCGKAAAQELEDRNINFDDGIRVCPEAAITRTSHTSLISLVSIPAEEGPMEKEFADMVYSQEGIKGFPISAFYPNGYASERTSGRSFRITIGRMEKERILEGAYKLGQNLNSVYLNRK